MNSPGLLLISRHLPPHCTTSFGTDFHVSLDNRLPGTESPPFILHLALKVSSDKPLFFCIKLSSRYTATLHKAPTIL